MKTLDEKILYSILANSLLRDLQESIIANEESLFHQNDSERRTRRDALSQLLHIKQESLNKKNVAFFLI